MDIQAFAERYRLKTGPGKTVEGRTGQIYEYGENRLGVMFAPPSQADKCGKWCPRTWNKFREAGRALGMIVQQNGDSEGCLLFDPCNREQAKLAIKIAAARPKRQVSARQLANLAKFGFRPALEAPSSV